MLVAVAGCKYLDQPKKVAELEKRLDEVALAVTDLTGKPVGLRPAPKPAAEEDEAEADDGHGKKGKGKGKGKDAKADKGKADKGKADKDRTRHGDDEADGADDEHAAADERPARPDWRKRDEAPADEHGGEHGEHGDASPEPGADESPPVAKAPAANVHWSYEGAEGPTAWSHLDPAYETCAVGQHQSPIDILPRRSEAPEVIFVYKPTDGAVVDNGHTLQVDLSPGSFIVVDGTRFDLVQFHVHTPSEHTIAGDSFPMEVHLVHKNKAGKLAVVGVLFTEGEASAAMSTVWKGAPKAKGSVPLKKPFDPAALLPKDHAAYRYDGSLTTPPCTEGVIWHVLKRPRTEDEARIEAFTRRFGANARPVQELGERELR